MTSKSTLVFVYGTLKSGHGNHRLLRGSVDLGPAVTLPQFELFGGWGAPTLSPDGSEQILGELYEVNEVTLADLDSLEGHPNVYCRTLTPVFTSDGVEHLAYVYLFPRGSFSSGIKTCVYEVADNVMMWTSKGQIG